MSNYDEATVNLYLTERCNFKCAHCLCEAGPRKSAAYVGNETLLDVATFLTELHEKLDIPCRLNLVGGEPTLDLKEFERVIRFLASRNQVFGYEMTTNGWWLNDRKDLYNFAVAIKPLLVKDDEVIIRISDDVYHDPFRAKGSEPYKRLFKEPNYVYSSWGRSQSTALEDYIEEARDEFPRGHFTWEKQLQLDGLAMLLEHARKGYLYIASANKGRKEHKVSPVGRAAKQGIGFQAGHCSKTDLVFDVSPKGKILGFCCLGSRLKVGATLDAPLSAVALRDRFMDKIDTSNGESCDRDCSSCPLTIQEFEKAVKI